METWWLPLLSNTLNHPKNPHNAVREYWQLSICQSGNERVILGHFLVSMHGPNRPCGPWIQLSMEASGVPQLLDTTPYSTAIFSAPKSHCLFPHGQRDYPGWLQAAALGGVGLLAMTRKQGPSLRTQQRRWPRTLPKPAPLPSALADPTKHGVGQPELVCSNN